MWVGEIDAADDELVGKWWATAKAADEFERPYATFWPLQAAQVSLRAENNAMGQHALAAIEGDDVVGSSQVTLPRLDNTHLAMMAPHTHPDHRRRGVGTALLEAGIELARVHSRSTILIEANLPATESGPGQTDGSRFLAKRGFSGASLEMHRVLDTPLATDLLDELDRATQPYREGYDLVTIGERVPDELIPGYCALQEAFNAEAPIGDLDLEPEVWDEARVRNAEARFARQGRHARGMAAIAPDGTVVALTEMVASEHHPQYALQGGTLVLQDHRGHRLGLAAKVANLRAFQQEFPDVAVVHSWNAEENGPMVAINDRLGFRPVEYLSEMQRKL